MTKKDKIGQKIYLLIPKIGDFCYIIKATKSEINFRLIQGEAVLRLVLRTRSVQAGRLGWYAYILECKNKTLYTGITNDIPRRVTEHKRSKGGHYTKSFGVNRLVCQEECSTRQEALKREAQIKGWTRRKKLALINGDMKLLKQP